MALARQRLVYKGETLELPLPDGPGQGAAADDRAGPGADADLPRGDRAEEHDARRRDRRRLDPDAVLARARRRVPPAARGGLRARGRRQVLRGLRHRPHGQRRSSPTTSTPPATRCARTSRSTSAAWARASRTSTTRSPSATGSRTPRARSRTSTSTASARRRWRRSRPQLIDKISLAGPPDVVRERLAIFRDAGVGTLMVSPMAWTFDERREQLRLVAELAACLRIYLGAFGDPGHAFPMIALGGALVAARPRGRAGHLAQVARAGRGGRDDVHAGARVPGVPDAREAAQALRGGRARGAGDPAVRARLRARRRGGRHPHPRPGAGRRARGRPARHARPPRPSVRRRRPPDLLDRRAAAAQRRGAGAVALGQPALRAGLAGGGPRPVQRDPPPARARAAAVGAHRALARADAGRDAAAARVPAALGAVGARGRAAAVGAAGRARRAAAGPRPGRARRPVDVAGPRALAAARRARGPGATRPCA